MVDQIAESYGGAASLICQLTDKGIQPVVSSDQDTNPFPAGATFPMEAQTFCKEVIATKDAVYVSNAEKDPDWSLSPVRTEFGFSSYYGLPLRWPDDEEIFGTICVMDRVPTDYQSPFMAWMSCFRDLVEADLAKAAQQLDKSKYLADLSEDLKAPVASIVGRAESLISSSLSEEQRLDIESIQTCAETLVCLLNDVMENVKYGAASGNPDAVSTGDPVPRALVVDDNQINQKVAGALLQSLGFAFDVADDGVEALNAVQSAEFDIILMDIQMPRLDGLEATRQIRSLGGWQETVPIIAVTANAMVSDKYKCIEAGMNDLLPKPIEPGRFTECVMGSLGRKLN